MTTSAIICKETVHRLLKDVKQTIKHSLTDNGIYYSHDENDITKGYAMIIGPSDTPYFGGYYFFMFDYPHDYPFSPPKVTFMTNDSMTRFNPNLYRCGKVCVSILNTWTGEKWSACQTINSILLTLCSLLNDSPLENEPGQTKVSESYIPYQKSIEFKNIDFAICDMLNSSKNNIPEPFKQFYPIMQTMFIKNYDNLLSFVTARNMIRLTVFVSMYNMTTHIDYDALEKKLIFTKEKIHSEMYEKETK
jgi:ubiquitin-protein ligase